MGDGRAAQALQRVDLLRDPHRPQLGGVAGPDPPGEDQRGEHRPELQDHRLHDDARGEVDGDAAGELVRGLERGHAPGERGGEQHDEQRAVADVHRLLDGPGKPDPPFHQPAPHLEHEIRHATHVAGRAQRESADEAPDVERERALVENAVGLGEPPALDHVLPRRSPDGRTGAPWLAEHHEHGRG